MNKIEKGFLLFLALIIALTGAISYLGLDQTTQIDQTKAEEKMTIALVNEDKGSVLNERKYDFGSEFVKSIEKENTHNWYVVSRGVAESGIKRNAYNMMIVIPNDFTEKALSIDSKSPEKVTLNYKINATENAIIKEKAEKTASSILNNFNKQIIDVYFASVIGNLQEAQDNIKKVVDQEERYTGVFNRSIHNPLSNYTSQFDVIQNGAVASKTSFKGLEDILTSFEENLGNGVQANQTYYDQYIKFAKMNETNGAMATDFGVQLSQLDQKMNSQDVSTQFTNLVSANQTINNQFKQDEMNTAANILTESVAIQNHLNTSQEKMEIFNEELQTTLTSDIKQLVKDDLSKTLKENAGENGTVNMSNFFGVPDSNMKSAIANQILELPTIEADQIDKLTLEDEATKKLKNVIHITNKYLSEFDNTPSPSNGNLPLIKKINSIKEDLRVNGITLTDEVELPANRKKDQKFTFILPKEFSLEKLTLKLPGRFERDYTPENGSVALPRSIKGTFKVKMFVKLKDDEIDVFQPIRWKWTIAQEDANGGEDEPETETPGDTEPPPAEKPAEPAPETAIPDSPPTDLPADSAAMNIIQTTAVESNQKQTENDTNEPVNEPGTPEDNKATPPAENGNTDSGETDPGNEEIPSEQPGTEPPPEGPPATDPGPTEPKEPPGTDPEPTPEPVVIENNTISHEILSPIKTINTSTLIKSVDESIKEYYRLATLYDIYFGINTNETGVLSTEQGLKDRATEDSLYHMFNKQDLVDILSGYMAQQVFAEVTKDTQELKAKIDSYLEIVNNASQNSDNLAGSIAETMAKAEVLNDSLAKTITDVEKWREQSLNLLDNQSTILAKHGEEQNMVLTLDDTFRSLLDMSDSLVTQSRGNKESADGVYQTFDDLEKEAKTIQLSGVTLVGNADTLLRDMTEKVSDDKNFAQNFASVLANSRIGDRQNEDLLKFLANPVQTKNGGIITIEETFHPYFMVLICFIVALFSAYVLSNNERKRLSKDTFETERALWSSNLPITLLTVGVGLVEGLLISLLSGYFLNMSQSYFIQWIGLVMLIMLSMTVLATYLLRQLKMAGMFILLTLFSMYLFFADALGLHFDKVSTAAKLKEFSPLQHIEQLLVAFSKGSDLNIGVMISLIAGIILGIALNLFVVNKFSGNREVEDPETIKAS